MRIAAALLIALVLGGSAAAAVDVGALRGELQDRTRQRDDARAESRALQQDIDQLNARLGELRAVEARGSAGVADKRAQLQALNGREAALRQEIGRNQAELAGLLSALELYRRDPPPALLVSPRSAEDAVRGAILARAVQPELARRAAVLRARADALQGVRRAITATSGDLFASESSLAETRAAIERTIRDKAALQRQLQADAVDADRRVQALDERLKALGVSTSVAASGPVSAPAAAPTRLTAPVRGQLIRRFGQSGPQGAATADGLTWRAAAGALVRAPAAGLVEYAGPLKGWGGVAILNLGGGYRAVLAGLDRVSAAPGRRVAAGEAVGSMEPRGQPELYMELRRDGTPQDPGPWLR